MFGREIWRRCRLFVLIVFLTWVPFPSQAKTAGLTAIVVYPGSSGLDTAQISGFVLNARNEVYQCGAPGNIDKSAYHKLTKVTLTVGMTLERNSQGVLMLARADQPATCVVPGNLKLEKDDALSPSAFADRAIVEGSVQPGSDPPISVFPPLKPGTKIWFVAAPDIELTNYLRAQRQNDIAGWKLYLSADAAGAHVKEVRKALSALYVDEGNADFQAWSNSKTNAQPDFAKLADARVMADQSHALAVDDAGTADLYKRIHAEVLDLSQQSQAQLDHYRTALKNQTAGYVDLVAAERLADGAYLVDASAPEAIAAEQQCKAEQLQLDNTLHVTAQQISGTHPDEAARAIDPYKTFREENSKIATDLSAIASLWIARAKKSESANDFEGAVSDLEKANTMVPAPDTLSLLTSAKQQAHVAANQAAVQAALKKSEDAETSEDAIHAYEVLDDLPPEQHALVADKLQTLQEGYVSAAEKRAKDLKKASEPINGSNDEQDIIEAHELTQRCSRLTDDPKLHDQLEVLADDLTTYYVNQGKKYADKPDGIGINIAWTYLSEALHYSSAANESDVRDEIQRIQGKHNIKSRLSIRVEFRDSTSRRDSVGFATQLTDAMAQGLESIGRIVSVISATDNPPVPPNFRLEGDVIEHELQKRAIDVVKSSTFRNGERQQKNPDYDKANRDYEQAKVALDLAHKDVQDAQSRNRKKEIEAAKKVEADDLQKVKEANDKLGSLSEFVVVPIEEKYNYVEHNIEVKPTIAIQFRIYDASNHEVVPPISVKEDKPDQYTKLENVQPTDTQGIRPTSGLERDDADFYRSSEYAARDALVKQAEQKVAALPGVLFDQARQMAASGDSDGAAELYILYLNSTESKDAPERKEAKAFLLKQFNFGDLALQTPVS